MRLAPFLVLLSLPFSCGRTSLPCNDTTCSTGCCDALGICRPGDVFEECGTNARNCVVCARGATCRAGRCEGMQTAMGGGSAGGSGTVLQGLALGPDVMLVIDRSGSLRDLEPATRQPRGERFNRELNTFINGLSGSARFGLTLYPSQVSSCSPPVAAAISIPQSDDASVLAMNASAVAARINSTMFAGGTPTSAAMTVAAAEPSLVTDARREHFLVLVTDGAPNCNERNPNSCATPERCQCTSGTCTGATCITGCFDGAFTTQSVASAAARGVRTFVIASGPETTTPVTTTFFNELATAGGVPLSCGGLTASECEPNDACQGTVCTRRFSSDVALGMQRVAAALRSSGTCRFGFTTDVPLNTKFEARLDDVAAVKGTDWQAEGRTAVRFVGGACTRLINGTARASFVLRP